MHGMENVELASYVCLSVGTEIHCSHWTNFHEILGLRIVRKPVDKITILI